MISSVNVIGNHFEDKSSLLGWNTFSTPSEEQKRFGISFCPDHSWNHSPCFFIFKIN